MGICSETPTGVSGVLACLAPCLERYSYGLDAFGHSSVKLTSVNTQIRTGVVLFSCDTNKKSAGIASNPSIIPGPEIAFTVDEQIQIPTPELIYRDTCNVCREGTMHPRTHYGNCLYNSPVASSPQCP